MRIEQLAERAGMTPKAMRFYEQTGLLPAPHRMPYGYRDYDETALDRLRFIKGAQPSGSRSPRSPKSSPPASTPGRRARTSPRSSTPAPPASQLRHAQRGGPRDRGAATALCSRPVACLCSPHSPVLGPLVSAERLLVHSEGEDATASRRACATGALSVLLAGAVAGAPAAQAGKPQRATETHTMAYDRFLYTCKGTATEARCRATDADRPDESIRWRIRKTGMNVWSGRGKVGPNRITWTVSGKQVPTHWQTGVGRDHLEMRGSGDQSRGKPFTFSYGFPSSPGRTVTGGHSLGGYVVCGGFGQEAMQPPLGADCTVASGPAEVLMVLAPVYPGAELVDP